MKGEGASASALGAKTARACDSCLRRRARWFCGADDAFLCHACDALVHSANQLASRHERVRLQTASAKVTTTTASWHSGFTRKARTPRQNKHLQQRLKEQVIFNNTSSVLPLVPELGGEEQELQLVDDELCRVPVFDVDDFDHVKKGAYVEEDVCDLESFSEFDVDLAEFAANVESLLGVGNEEAAAGQVLFDYKEDVAGQLVFDCKKEEETKNETVKVVKDEVEFDDLESVFDMTNDEVVFHWNMYEDEDESLHQEEQKQCLMASCTNSHDGVGVPSKEETKRERFLRLNYEEVINAWASQGGSPSPWTTGNPPPNFTFDDDTWQNYYSLGGSSGAADQVRSLRGQLMGMDGGREARVSRYREKRRTRLFAKKIRYEVRKLNAEKRPRMKGRFVKRTSLFAGAGGATEFQTNYH